VRWALDKVRVVPLQSRLGDIFHESLDTVGENTHVSVAAHSSLLYEL